MTQNKVVLKPVSRQDVARINEWLKDEEVSASWFGRYAYGDPAHLGYHPGEITKASDEEWERVFSDPAHRILSIYTPNGEHIGELHVAIEEALGDGQLSILIGRKDKWHHGFGSAAVEAALDLGFNQWGLYRMWADVPEYNKPARALFQHMGFVVEGTLRQSRPHEGARFDSVVMGLLATEYARQADKPASEPAATY
ncbi:MAG: GNAT family N-acetyltransferase [SAR202 cluster bacterium]|nr:GNAT family N-acetyltransferase [SAR202 cluster bacterium]